MWVRVKRKTHVGKFHRPWFTVGKDGYRGYVMTHKGFHVVCHEQGYVRLDLDGDHLEVREDTEVRFPTKCKYCHAKDEQVK